MAATISGTIGQCWGRDWAGGRCGDGGGLHWHGMGEAKPHPNNRSAARRIVSTLRAAGHVAYFAGGCVRDELLGMNPQDYDIATDAPPERVAELFHNTRAVGRAFGVMLVRMRGATVEVATFREEADYSDNRRPDSVKFSDAEADARRRDFTINALFLDPLHPQKDRVVSGGRTVTSGKVIDFVGGLDDLRQGVIRAVGDPDERLAEDHLRALRGVRFAARLAFRIEEATAAAIARHARELKGVSRERIGDELRRMFDHPSRGRAAEWLHRLGLDGPVLDEPVQGEVALPRVSGLGDLGEVGVPWAVAGLAAWAADRLAVPGLAPTEDRERWDERVRDTARSWREGLCLTNDERAAFRGILEGLGLLRWRWAECGVAARKRAAGSGWFGAALAIYRVEDVAGARAIERSVGELARTPSGIAPEPLINGYDLLEAGYSAGPGFARCLELVYDAQLEDRIATRAEAMTLAASLLDG